MFLYSQPRLGRIEKGTHLQSVFHFHDAKSWFSVFRPSPGNNQRTHMLPLSTFHPFSFPPATLIVDLPLRGGEGSPHPSPPPPILSSGVNAPSKREVFDRSSIHARPAGKRRGETHVSDRPTDPSDARGKAGRHEKKALLLLPYITTATAGGGGFRQTFFALHTLSCLIAGKLSCPAVVFCTCSSSNPIPDTLPPPPPLLSLSLSHTHTHTHTWGGGPSDSPFPSPPLDHLVISTPVSGTGTVLRRSRANWRRLSRYASFAAALPIAVKRAKPPLRATFAPQVRSPV